MKMVADVLNNDGLRPFSCMFSWPDEGETIGKSEVAERLHITHRTAERELKHLVELRCYERDGAGRSTAYKLASK